MCTVYTRKFTAVQWKFRLAFKDLESEIPSMELVTVASFLDSASVINTSPYINYLFTRP